MPTISKKVRKEVDFSLISREKLLALYSGLIRCHMLEEFIAKNMAARRSSTRTSSAAAVAACIDQRPDDVVVAPARDFHPAFIHGKSLSLIFSGLQTPTLAQRSRFAAQVRSTLAEARCHHRAGDRRIVFIFGRPATGRQWQALLRAAATERLPIIFVCKGQSHRRSLRPARYLPAIAVDRDDVVAIYRVASEGIAHARRGNGPTLIECIPWLSGGTHERSAALHKMEDYLAQKQINADRRKAKVIEEFQLELNRRKSAARK